MSISLLSNPALIWLMALAVIPILVHLFAKSRPPQHPFSNIDFLRKILKKTARIRRPQDWLTLILRTLAAAALLFAFLQPILVSNDPQTIAGADDNLIIIIDQSASMAATQGSTTRLTEACSQASNLLAKLSPDNANIIWIKSTPTAVYPAPGPNLSFLSDALQHAEPTDENGAISAAISLAIDQLKKCQGNHQIILISDFQKNAWENADFTIPSSIKFSKISVSDKALANLAIDSITTTPSSPVAGQDLTISCRIKNYSDKPKSSSIYLNAGGGRQSKDIEVAAWGQTEVTFKTRFSHHGIIPITVSLSEDTFPADDHRHSVIKVRESLRLCSLVKHGTENSPSAAILARLARALPWLSHNITDKLPKPGSCDILFIHQWDGDQLNALTELSDNGTSIIVNPSNKCPIASLQSLLNLPKVNTSLSINNNKKGWKAERCADNSIFEIFHNNEFGQPAQGSFRQRFELPSEWEPFAIIHYSQDNIPAILLNSNFASPRLIWNLPFDPALSNWVTQEPFVTFMAELFLHVQSNNRFNSFEQLPGTPLTWVLPDNIDAQTVTLLPPSGKPWQTSLIHTKQGATLQSKKPAVPGIYQWRTGSTTVHTNFVNFPTTESDLRTLDPAELPQGESADKNDILRAQALNQGIPIWHWLIAAVILLLIAEAFSSTAKRASTT